MGRAADLSESKSALLERMLRGEADAVGRMTDAVRPRERDATVPISVEQRHVWMHAAMAPSVPLYNEPITIHRSGAFDPVAFEWAFNEVLARHEIWRSAFVVTDAGIEQVVRNDLHVALPVVDLTALPATEREAAALRIATEDARRPFDLTEAPLFRARVLKLADDEHRLHLTLHHIIFDGVSIYRVLVPELAASYAAFAAGRRVTLPAPALQYADYALWRARHAASDTVIGQLDFWRQELAGELPVLQLPTDHARPALPAHRGTMATFSLSGALTEAVKTLSRNEGTTPYMTLLATFKVLLFRYTGQEDIVVGGVTDTRRRPELEPLMGYFLNSLALRSRPSAALPFRDYLRQVRNTVLGALGASDVPFDRVVQALRPRRDPSRHPLFQVLFSVEPPVAPFPEGWDLTQMDVSNGAAKFDLYLELDERPEGMIGRFLYSTELFEAPTIERMIGHWITLLEAVTADPGCTLGRLKMLTRAEVRLQRDVWNDTRRDYPATTVDALITAQAARTPDAIAVTCNGVDWTYAALDRRAARLASRLAAAGVTRGTLVALCLDRSADMLAGLLAIMKAGAAYLPLDPSFPPSRLALILDDARPAALLTERAMRNVVPGSDACVVLVDDPDADVADLRAPDDRSPEDLAYVLYTSGSTGKPKGVEVPHRAVVNLLTSMQREPGCEAVDALLAVTTVSFDIAALELFLPLICGGRVVLADRATAADPAKLAALIGTSGCTMMQATPATWRGLLESGWSGRAGLKILCGGEALPRDLADQLLRCGSGVWNLYGPTETTIWSLLHPVEGGAGPVPIGRPIANTRVHVLDPRGLPVPVGVTGELHIGGAGLARGYRNATALTRERFAERAVAPGERLYGTGDLARWRADGTIECLGRTDAQVKIRGFRVGVEEIEAALTAHPAIGAAAVRAWPDRSGTYSLAAYIVARGEPVPAAGELRAFLRGSLPDYMVPTRYVALASLPMTPNAKIDRNALPVPGLPVRGTDLEGIEPSDDCERRLAAIWADVLGVTDIASTDDFFDLGGHSLLVTTLLRRIEVAFDRRLPMAAVFQAPTLAQMAALLRDRAAPLPRIVQLQPHGARPPLFWLSPGPVFRPLAHALGPDQPLLGVALDVAEVQALPTPTRFADIARLLVRDIRAAQPAGPYYIGGWCTGGILAFEVASQFIAAGETVGLLMLLHAVNPVQYKSFGPLAIKLSKLAFHLQRTFDPNAEYRWRDLAVRLHARLRGSLGAQGPASPAQRAFDAQLDRAAVDYVPGTYPGDVVLFQPADRPDVLDYRAGWADVVSGAFASFDVPGTHRTVLDSPQVELLGAAMRARLKLAQAAHLQAVAAE